MLNNITGGQAYIDKIKKVSERNGSGVIVVGSEVIFHVVKNYTILTSDEIIRLVFHIVVDKAIKIKFV